jgi:dUTP pyrophosphatase
MKQIKIKMKNIVILIFLKMKFLIKAQNSDVKKMYQNHSTYNNFDSGLDLFIIGDVTIEGGETKLVKLGIQCQLQSKKWYGKEEYHGYLMFPRSSISKTPLRLANSVGLIDREYRGELMAAFHNTGKTPYTLSKGERYVQLTRADLGYINFEVVDALRDTKRHSGFGSSGR